MLYLPRTFIASLLLFVFSVSASTDAWAVTKDAKDPKEFYAWVAKHYDCSYFKHADGTTRYQTTTIPACDKEAEKTLCIASLDCRKKAGSKENGVGKMMVEIVCNGPSQSCPSADSCLNDFVTKVDTYYEISQEAAPSKIYEIIPAGVTQ